jgi:hypothetical protein
MQLSIPPQTTYKIEQLEPFSIYSKYCEKLTKSLIEIDKIFIKKLKLDGPELEQYLPGIARSGLPTSVFYTNYMFLKTLKEENNLNKSKKILSEFKLWALKDKTRKELQIRPLNCLKSIDHDFADDIIKDPPKEGYDVKAHTVEVPEKKEFQQGKKYVEIALATLANTPELNHFHKQVLTYLESIVLFAGVGLTGGTTVKTMGDIFIRLHTPNLDANHNIGLAWLSRTSYYLEQLVHETSHVHLDLIMEFDPIILNGSEADYESPIRNDKRPMRGVFHATYVLYCLKNMYETLLKQSHCEEQTKRLDIIEKHLRIGILSVRKDARLTEYGNLFMKYIEKGVEL